MRLLVKPMISGMGELHLDVLVDRMLREFKVQANVGRPRVAYRETITQTGHEGRLSSMSNSLVVMVNTVMLYINAEPAERGRGIIFENKIFGGSIPQEYIHRD